MDTCFRSNRLKFYKGLVIMRRKIKSLFNINIFVIIIFAVVFYAVYYYFVYSVLAEFSRKNADNTVLAGGAAVNSSIEGILDDIAVISKNPYLASGNISVADKLEYLEDLNQNKDKKTVCFIAESRNAAAVSKNESKSFDGYSFYKEAWDGNISISEPILANDGKTTLFPAAAPITDAEGNICSVLVCLYQIDDLTEVINNITIGNNTLNLILNKEGFVIASNNSELLKEAYNSEYTAADDDSDKTNYAFNLGNEILENRDGSNSFNYNGKKYRAFYAQLKDNDMIFVSAAPENELYSGIDRLSFAISGVTVAVILLSLILIFYSKILTKHLHDAKKKANTVLNSINLYSMLVDDQGNIIKANNNLLKATGYNSYEITQKTVYDLIPENYRKDFKAYLSRLCSGIGFSEIDIPIATKEKGYIYVLWNSNTEGIYNTKKSRRFEIIGTNISKIKDYEKKIQKLAYFDPLTGLNNVAYLEEYFNRVVSTDGKNRRHAFIFIDLDNFKYINDMFGHSAGDEFIVDICRRISEIGSEKAKLYRRNGDEFIVLFEDFSDESELEEYVEKIRRTINTDYHISSLKYNLTASIGISIYPNDSESFSELFKFADIARNTAKENGKGNVQYFTNEMKNEMYEVITIENDLKSAIENDEFILYYQPQYEIGTGKLYGFEALIRWKSPNRGFVSPAKFIPQAEKNQMIIKIGDWALETACDFINRVKAAGFNDICVSVNVSVVQMLCEDYVDKTLDILKRKNIDFKNIKLEITESVLMESIDDMLKKINKLNNLGIYFSLDDFGTGYSSLTYLNRIPLKVLKIDKSFVDMILEEGGNPEIISSIIDLAHDIKLEVVAEGIEESSQLEWLKGRGCNIAQGFYMGKPLSEDKAFEMLGSNMYDRSKKEIC